MFRFPVLACCACMAAELAAASPGNAEADRARDFFLQGEKAWNDRDEDRAFAALDAAASSPAELWSFRAQCAETVLLCRRGDADRAAIRLQQAEKNAPPDSAYVLDSLHLLVASYRNDDAAFPAVWRSFLRKYAASGNAIVAEALRNVVRRKNDRSQFGEAAYLLDLSLLYQTTEDGRRAVLRALFDVHMRAGSKAEILAGVAEKYERWFPDDPVAAQLLLRAARFLADAGRFDDALKIWEKLSVNREREKIVRESALYTAAIYAEKSSRDDVARTMYQSLIGLTSGRPPARLEYGSYLLRCKDFPGAVEVLRDLWIEKNAESEVAGARLLQALICMQKSEEAHRVAETLLSSPVYGRYAAIKLAEIKEMNGDFSGAREQYLELERRYPQDLYNTLIAFRAAGLAARLNDPAAPEEFAAFSERYPDDPKAPRALFLAMRSAAGAERAEKFFSMLENRYAATSVFPYAVLLQIRFEIQDGRWEKVRARIEKYRTRMETSAVAPEFGTSRLQCLLKFGRLVEADALARDLTERFSGEAAAPEIFFLAGNAASAVGDYARAQEYYERAEKLRPEGDFGEHARGRIADMNYVLFPIRQQPEMLARAEAAYRTLAETGKDASTRLEALYQQGRCMEFFGRTADAGACYGKVLELAGQMKKSGAAPEPVWCARAVYGAIRIGMKSAKRSDRQAALAAADAFEKLDLPQSGEDFAAIKQEISQKFRYNKR